MINKIILTGRLTSAIELRTTNDGVPYTFFTLAVNRNTQQNQTDFISCIAWRGTAETMNKFLAKGSLIGIEGRLEVFRTNNEGQYQTRTNVNVSTFHFLETRSQNRNNDNNDLSYKDEPRLDGVAYNNDNSNDSNNDSDNFSNTSNDSNLESDISKDRKDNEDSKNKNEGEVNLDEIDFDSIKF